ncbi:hypothetical protein LTR08_006049 [Meristemomyces frigidus]|nr:hypothetical protein LTR08_006049 [Meristemomyces frigidus]
MADTAFGSPLPIPGSDGRNEPTPSAVQPREKRNRRRSRKDYSQSLSQADGTVSDTVTNPTTSPRARAQPSHRQSAAPAVPSQIGSMGLMNGQKPRPVSTGGQSQPDTPAKEQAYAGPTFQASPAPSSLPVPRFFSKSVPNAGGQPSLQARMEGEKTPEHTPEKPESSPETDVVEPVPRNAAQSPLDMFFNADKAERQKSRSGSNLLLSPETAARRMPATEPRNVFQQSGKSIFLRELDGDSEDMPSPRTVPPNNRPALVERAHSSPCDVPQSPKAEEQREAYTKSLKDLLFNSVNVPTPSTSTPPQSQRRVESDAQAFNTPSPFHRPATGPSTPASPIDQQDQYALHYGNRNLSPLFKASRTQTPTKPSNLRQEIANSRPIPTSDSQQPPRQMPQIDPNSFSRDYLDQHIRASRPVSLPHFPFTNGVPGNGNGNGNSASFSGSSAQRGVQAGASGHSVAPRTGGAKDIRGMEDDLRKMLNLNVLG